jgi:hypothetical protein
MIRIQILSIVLYEVMFPGIAQTKRLPYLMPIDTNILSIAYRQTVRPPVTLFEETNAY